MNKICLIIWGLNDVGMAVARAAMDNDEVEIIGAYSQVPEHAGQDTGSLVDGKQLNVAVTSDVDLLLSLPADVVVLTLAASLGARELEEWVTRLLASGKNVIATIPDSRICIAEQAIQDACARGNASFHCTGLMPHLLLERFALTLAKALQHVDHVRMLQSIDCATAPIDLWGGLSRIGFGGQESPVERLAQQDGIMRAVATNVARQLYGEQAGQLRIERDYQTTPASDMRRIHDTAMPKGGIVAVQTIHRAFLDGHCFLTSEEHWYLGRDHAIAAGGVPYGNFTRPYNFAFEVSGEPGRLDGQLQFEANDPQTNPLVHVMAQGVMAALHPVCAAAPGIVLNDATPRYQLDERMPGTVASAVSTPARDEKKYRVVIWGPGEIGGAVTRAALQRRDIELVGAKVFSPGKAGRDLGELVGIAPIGIRATLSKDAIKALKPDCVIVTPQPRAIVEGLDDDVTDLLASGINVITSAAYHNVTMPNWLVSAQTPSALLREVAATTGMARNRREAIAFALNRRIMFASRNGLLGRVVPGVVDVLLKPAIARAMPFRATPQRIQQACRQGNASLHGTGVHPTFMAERVGLQLAKLLPDTTHMRFIEAADFSYMPDGMWGGLDDLGFGKPVGALDERYLIARAGDFYYGDVVGNVAHLLFGVPSTQVRVERSFRALPARRDFMVGSRLIRKGCSAALHMVHKGYIGDHHFFTNEECWYLGPECEFRGDDLPFGNFSTPLSYTIETTGKTGKLGFQLSMAGTGRAAELMGGDTSSADRRCALGQLMRQEGVTNPITNATAMALLDAVGPVCDLPAGVVIDDVAANFRLLAPHRSPG